MAITLKQFLDKDSAVKAARKKLQAARAEVQKQQQALASGAGRLDDASRQAVQRRLDAAQLELNKQEDNAARIEAERSDFFGKNKKAIRTEERVQSVAEAKQQLEELLIQGRQDPRVANSPVYVARVQDLNDRIRGTGKYAPKPKAQDEVSATATGAAAGSKDLRNYGAEQQGAFQTVRNMTPAQRKDLIASLKNAGYNPPNVSEVYTDQLGNEYLKAITENYTRSKQFGELSFAEFIAEKTIETNAIKQAGGLGGAPSRTVATDTSVTRRTGAQTDEDINEIAIKVLGREINEEDKAEDWYANLVNSINKMYEKGTTTVTTMTGRGSAATGSKRITTPAVSDADIDALIERRLRKGDPESVGRKERLDFVSWLNKSLGD